MSQPLCAAAQTKTAFLQRRASAPLIRARSIFSNEIILWRCPIYYIMGRVFFFASRAGAALGRASPWQPNNALLSVCVSVRRSEIQSFPLWNCRALSLFHVKRGNKQIIAAARMRMRNSSSISMRKKPSVDGCCARFISLSLSLGVSVWCLVRSTPLPGSNSDSASLRAKDWALIKIIIQIPIMVGLGTPKRIWSDANAGRGENSKPLKSLQSFSFGRKHVDFFNEAYVNICFLPVLLLMLQSISTHLQTLTPNS